MIKDVDRVLIVGGGPIGLIAGYWLARKGIPVHVVEKSVSVPLDLRASTWHPATMDMLEEFGVTDVILSNGSITPSWQYRYRDEPERVTFRLEVLAGETRHPYRVQCEQFHVVRYLSEQLPTLDNGTLWLGAEATALRQYDDHVELTVSHEGEAKTLRGRFLLGADGARSIVRESLGLGFIGKTYDSLTMVAVTDFPFQDYFEDLSGVAYFWNPGGDSFSLLRVPDRWRSGITPKPGQTPEEALSDESIEAHFQSIVPSKQSYRILAKGMYRTHQRVTETFNVGRIALAGDAAHLNNPNGGLGMNSGVHDAINLVDKILQIWHGDADLDLFDLYTRQRRAIAVDYVHNISDANHHRMRERDPDKRKAIMAQMRQIAEDPMAAKAYLMKTSMIDAVRQAAATT